MKKFITIMLVLVMLLSLVACGASNTPAQTTKEPATQEPAQQDQGTTEESDKAEETPAASGKNIKIVLWGLNPMAVGSGNKEMLDAFKASHDNIELDPQTTPGSNGYATQDVTKLLASIAGGTPPNVTTLDRFTAAQFASRNALTSIDEYIEATKLDMNSYYKFAVDEISFNNKIWALPSDMGARLLYWNKDLFKKSGLDPEKPPETWDELLDYSKKLTITDKKGNITQVGFIPNFGNSWLYMFGFQNGGEFLSSDGKTALLNSTEIVEALDYMVKGYDVNGGAKKINAYASTFQSEANDPFITGQLAMVIHNIAVLNTVARFAPDLDFGAALAPAPEGKQKITWAGGWSWAIPKGAKNPKESFDVIKWLSTEGIEFLEAGKKAYNKSMGRPYIPGSYPYKPMNEKFIQENTEELNKVNPNLATAFKTYLESMDVAKYRPVSPVGELLWTEHARAIDKAIYHEMTPKEALDAGNKIVQEQLDLFWADFKPAE